MSFGEANWEKQTNCVSDRTRFGTIYLNFDLEKGIPDITNNRSFRSTIKQGSSKDGVDHHLYLECFFLHCSDYLQASHWWYWRLL